MTDKTPHLVYDNTPRTEEQKNKSDITWGFITAILVAPIGLIFGIRLLLREKLGPGIAVVLTAVFFMGLGIMYVTAQNADAGANGTESGQGPCIITFSGSTICGADASSWCLEFDPTDESSGCRSVTRAEDIS